MCPEPLSKSGLQLNCGGDVKVCVDGAHFALGDWSAAAIQRTLGPCEGRPAAHNLSVAGSLFSLAALNHGSSEVFFVEIV